MSDLAGANRHRNRQGMWREKRDHAEMKLQTVITKGYTFTVIRFTG